MEDLKQLMSIVSKQKVKQIEIISENITLSPLTRKLYNGLLSGHYKNDEDAISDIYGENYSYESFKKLKYRLKQRLINTLFFIDVQAYSSTAHQKANIRNSKNLAAILILISKNRKAAANLAEITITSSIKYDLTEIIVLLAPKLVRHYGLFEYNKKKYSKYLKLLNEYQNILIAENSMEEFYVEFGRRLLTSKNDEKIDDEIVNLEKRYYDFLSLHKKVESYNFMFLKLSSDFFVGMIRKDYKKLDKVCLNALNYFNSRKGFSLFPIFDFNLKYSVVHLYFKRYKESLECLEKCDTLNPLVGNYNWFTVRSYRLLVLINQKRYTDALPVVSDVTNNPKFKKSYELFRQQWLVKEAYFQFLIEAKKVDSSKYPDITLRKFRLNRFLNDVDLMIKDKKGLNVPVQIIEVLYLFLEGKSELLESRLGALRQYNYRYLRKQKRSFAFIKMLCSIPEFEYNKVRIRKRMSKYRQQLKNNPMELTEQEIQIEIIPYEDLWEMVMEMIGNEDLT